MIGKWCLVVMSIIFRKLYITRISPLLLMIPYDTPYSFLEHLLHTYDLVLTYKHMQYMKRVLKCRFVFVFVIAIYVAAKLEHHHCLSVLLDDVCVSCKYSCIWQMHAAHLLYKCFYCDTGAAFSEQWWRNCRSRSSTHIDKYIFVEEVCLLDSRTGKMKLGESQ